MYYMMNVLQMTTIGCNMELCLKTLYFNTFSPQNWAYCTTLLYHIGDIVQHSFKEAVSPVILW